MKSDYPTLSLANFLTLMLEKNNIDKSATTIRMNSPISSQKGKIFTSGNVIDDKYMVLDFVGKGRGHLERSIVPIS